MDKITRLLLLYSKLIHGEKINKAFFCLEMDCLPRSFDRDVEDLRLFLSETFSTEELVYDRLNNVYYLTGTHRTDLEMIEYLFIERILLDTSILRKDEFEGLITHLLAHTENANKLLEHTKNVISLYKEPSHSKALMKIYSDLITAIKNKSVIKIKYIKSNIVENEQTLIPCSLRYDLGYIYLTAFTENIEDEPIQFRLDTICSFTILRTQTREEQKRVLLINKKIL